MIANALMGTSRRRHPMPSAFMAINSLSADIRPSPISTPTRTEMGSENDSTPGKALANKRTTSQGAPVWRTTRPIICTSCGTKNTNVQITKPRNAAERISRQI